MLKLARTIADLAGCDDIQSVHLAEALKADGTVVAWGDNSSSQATVPTGLTSVTAIAAGASHNLALKSDQFKKLSLCDFLSHLGNDGTSKIYWFDASRKKQMTDSNQTPVWGFHLNETIYSSLGPTCPKWANPWEQQNWQKLGVVVWGARVNRVTHLHGNQALQILQQSRQSDAWKKKGWLVGEISYRITLPSDIKSKTEGNIIDQPEPKPVQEDDWYLTHTIQLAPDQAQQFVSFLERHETNLEEVIATETAERRRILAQAYSMILSWTDEREKGSASIKTSVARETKSVPNGAITIPHGKYLTMPKWPESVE